MTDVLVLVTGPPAAGKTTLAGPLAADLIEVFCRCPAAEVERRFAARAPDRHPGHVDHLLGPEMRAALARGIGSLRLGGPVPEVDTTRAVDVPGVAAWVRARRNLIG